MTLTACDVGGVAAPTDATLDAAVELLVDRNDVTREFLDADAPAKQARCAADRLTGDAEFASLYAIETKFTEAEQQRFEALVGDAIAACRGG